VGGMELTFEQLLDVYELISQKGWLSENSAQTKILEDKAYELFSIAESPNEYKLLRALIDKYFLCKEYMKYSYALSNIIEGVFYGEKVIVIPVSDSDGKIKSGHSIAYELSSFLDRNLFDDCDVVESLQSFESKIKEYSIIVVDDFIGSGTQFRKFSRECQSRYGVDKGDIYLFSIAIMKGAYSRVLKECYGASSCFVFNKAISDDEGLSAQFDAMGAYKNIESRAMVGKNYTRGYLHSEALVTMKRTPNNTLPIFWCSSKSNGSAWPALFPRT
jgi:hypothetical protein